MERQLILISGVSGAGKTTASMFLEDLGYRCIDQYPCELLSDLVDMLENDDSFKYAKVALTISITDLERFAKLLTNVSLNPKLILLDCASEEVINRYKFTRRVHPLLLNNVANSLEEAVTIEKSIIEKYKAQGHIIDTTYLTTKQHKNAIEKILNNEDEANLVITFKSFGFKNGVPDDCDIVFDVRILENPYYVEELRNLTGLDKAVSDYVLAGKNTDEYLKKVIDYLDFTFKAYSDNEKRHITVCIGCTGGQHRSVTVAEYLFNYYKDKYVCSISHREIKNA